MQLRQSDLQETPAGVPGELGVITRLSLFPEIYKGVQTELDEKGFVLMPLDQTRPEEYRWRVVTYTEPDLSQFITSFVYAALDGDNLLLGNEENNIKINNTVLATRYLTLPLRNEQWLLVLYGLAALFTVLGLLSKLRN